MNMSANAIRRANSKAGKMLGVKDDNLDVNLLADGCPPIPPPPPYPKRELCPKCKGSKTVLLDGISYKYILHFTLLYKSFFFTFIYT